MGYSCSIAADYSLSAIQQIKNPESDYPSNRMGNGWFWSRGKEQRDGAITGQVFKPSPNPELATKGYCRLAGTFRIEPNGVISRFPGTTKEERRQALKTAYRLCCSERNHSQADYLYRNVLNEIHA